MTIFLTDARELILANAVKVQPKGDVTSFLDSDGNEVAALASANFVGWVNGTKGNTGTYDARGIVHETAKPAKEEPALKVAAKV